MKKPVLIAAGFAIATLIQGCSIPPESPTKYFYSLDASPISLESDDNGQPAPAPKERAAPKEPAAPKEAPREPVKRGEPFKGI